MKAVSISIAVFIAFSLLFAVSTTLPAHAQNIYTATPVADAFVLSDFPDNTYNTVALLVDGPDRYVSYIGWEQNRPKVITATLFLAQRTSATSSGLEIASAGWFDELTVTWNNQPDHGFVFAEVPLVAGILYEVEVDVTDWWNYGGTSMRLFNSVGRARFYTRSSSNFHPRIEYVLAPPPPPEIPPASTQNIALPSGGEAVVTMTATAGELFISGLLLLIFFVFIWQAIERLSNFNAKR